MARAKRRQVKGIKKAMTKSQVLSEIAEGTELTKKEVAAVFSELEHVIERHIKKGSVGNFSIPGILKIKTIKKPARKARKNVPNPFKPGELMDIKAKPASIRVKCLPLKKLKDMV
ncbi:MAG: HU family DNA-binding protein [Bdellovibrionales bacterium]|nr:HU family DNA-binding protein [Bdellovibrionales bacterium]